MRPTNCIQNLLAGLQAEMICVIQTEHTSRLSELLICQALEGCLCCDGHKDRQWDGAMREVESAGAGFGGLIRVMRQKSSQRRISFSVWGMRSRTEHLACRSKVNAEGMDLRADSVVVDMAAIGAGNVLPGFLQLNLVRNLWHCMKNEEHGRRAQCECNIYLISCLSGLHPLVPKRKSKLVYDKTSFPNEPIAK